MAVLDIEFEELASGLRFPEGPVALADGSILLTEIERGTVTRVGSDGAVDVVADVGGGPNGLAIGPDGAVYVANNGRRFEFHDLGGSLIPGDLHEDYWGHGSIQRLDLSDGSFETVYVECDGNPIYAPNDLVFDSSGGMWFTDHGRRLERTVDRSGVYYAQPDGSAITEVVFPLDAPNGVGMSPDYDELYVAETHTGRVWSWPVPEPGVVTEFMPINAGGALVHSASGTDLFDSLAVDSAGNVCVATLGTGGITVAAPDGSGADFVPVDDPITTNICFGGPDLTTAFVTASFSGRLLKCTWPRPGLQLAYNA
jgi:gluconolactonase